MEQLPCGQFTANALFFALGVLVSLYFSREGSGATLSTAIKQVKRVTAVRSEEAFVDRGFKGTAHHSEDVSVYVSGRKRLTRTLKALLRRRSAIEPVIGHLKQERNHLFGKEGDRSNAMLTGCGFNLRKLWRFFKSAGEKSAERLIR